MIILDTNVISELWKVTPEPMVLAWIDGQMIETLYLSAVTVAELRLGTATMPQGKRRTIYQDRLGRLAPSGSYPAFDLGFSKLCGFHVASQGVRQGHRNGGCLYRGHGHRARIYCSNPRHEPVSCCRSKSHQSVGWIDSVTSQAPNAQRLNTRAKSFSVSGAYFISMIKYDSDVERKTCQQQNV